MPENSLFLGIKKVTIERESEIPWANDLNNAKPEARRIQVLLHECSKRGQRQITRYGLYFRFQAGSILSPVVMVLLDPGTR